MPKFSVKMPIELNGKLYVPASAEAESSARSRGNGGSIPVDSSGFIVLTAAQAAGMVCGQIAEPPAPPARSKDKDGGKDGD